MKVKDGEYGEKGIYAGVPAVLNSQGVKELVEYHLADNMPASGKYLSILINKLYLA